MKEEIDSAAEFLSKLLKMGCSEMTRRKIDVFRVKIEKLLVEHFRDHWFPQKPFKGSGYRCLRINHKMDPMIAKAAEAVGLKFSELSNVFPNELTLWIDPREVSYRIGENGSICVLFDGDESAESGSCSSDSELESSPTDGKKSPPLLQETNNYSHPFPTPPSSPPTVQGYFYHQHQNHNHRSNIPSSNSSCRKDLNSTYWGSYANPLDVRSSAMMNMEQLASYVTS